jgi:hypothetical protein
MVLCLPERGSFGDGADGGEEGKKSHQATYDTALPSKSFYDIIKFFFLSTCARSQSGCESFGAEQKMR